MKHTLRFLPEVADDAITGYEWYQSKSPGLGDDFLRMFYASVGEISRKPLIYQRVYSEFRRCLLRRFPFAVYFRIVDRKIIVFGLFHCARDPHKVTDALHKRRE